MRLPSRWCTRCRVVQRHQPDRVRVGAPQTEALSVEIVLHSAAWDDLRLLRLAEGRFQNRRGTLLLFYGNEYHNMQEKIAFAHRWGPTTSPSQLPLASAQWLYADCRDLSWSRPRPR
ncbi:MAG: hypothetical protein U0231_00690 [Nitrospiraceae bacterium]